MSLLSGDMPLVIVGAGAAGLGASEQARTLGQEHIVLEAAHRIGGRALTETLNNEYPVDLGCHWMHCGSQNPLATKAKIAGEPFETKDVAYRDFVNGEWRGDEFSKQRWDYIEGICKKMESACKSERGSPIWDSFDEDNPFSTWAAYWLSLMHSNDPDQVAVSDHTDFIDTYEDWPVKNGYGAHIARCGASAPVSLNTMVQKIDYSGPKIIIETNKGRVRAGKVILTVSTGVLAAHNIVFTPKLPDETLQAISDLPLGNYNYLFYAFEKGVLSNETVAIAYQRDEVATSVRLREFGRPIISIPVGGRFAWWLESQSEDAIKNWGL
nr:FAD-dependent oxidoreductase [Granulosicoccus sp.]